MLLLWNNNDNNINYIVSKFNKDMILWKTILNIV